ncbi:MAGE family-domain-containing protein [Podospora australis]|uniref:MAGE family-domain-containing protein n=1 Tax=Podospora australis TaxID=1536484 RepID=A0AAN7AJR1_9PEZI|nr:MAGE family-domain-containing protein [Podospora australis]
MPRQPSRKRPASDDEDVEMQPNSRNGREQADSDADEHMGGVDDRDKDLNQAIKHLVRYAIACEFSRTPIRRDGIRDKVPGASGKAFKKVFAGAQRQLQATFGMELVELPVKDKALLTMEQKRKAARSQSAREATSNTYVLVTTLPQRLSGPQILPPNKVQSLGGEASYIALYTMLVAIVTLSGGELSDPRLRRHLGRLNAAANVPSMDPGDALSPTDKTEAVLQRMVKQGYLVKVVENRTAGDDDSTSWHVGPRGKVEVTKEAIAAVIRIVYKGSNEDLESKIECSLKTRKPPDELQEHGNGAEGGVQENEEEEEEEEDELRHMDPGPSRQRRARTRN